MITIGKAWELNEEPSVQEKEMLLVYVRALGMKVGISCEMTFEEFRKFRGSTSVPTSDYIHCIMPTEHMRGAISRFASRSSYEVMSYNDVMEMLRKEISIKNGTINNQKVETGQRPDSTGN